MQKLINKTIALFSSTRFAIFNILFFIINLISIKLFNINSLAFVSLALFLISLNLFGCLISRYGLAKRTMTLFHILLLAFILTSAYESLYFFYGYIELAESQTEKQGYQRFIKGALHKNRLKDITVLQDKISASFLNDFCTDIKSILYITKKKVIQTNS